MKQDFEITAYRFNKNSAYPGNINRKQPDGLFQGGYSDESMWDNGKMNNNREIYEIKRLSDGKYFKIGDRTSTGDHIYGFEVGRNGLEIHTKKLFIKKTFSLTTIQ